MHVGEMGMSKASDEEILAFSLGRNAVVVTLDADFHAILAVSGAQGPCVIRMRLQGLGASEVVDGPKGRGRFRSGAESRLPDHREGPQDGVSPAADRSLRVKRQVPRAFLGSNPRWARILALSESRVTRSEMVKFQRSGLLDF